MCTDNESAFTFVNTILKFVLNDAWLNKFLKVFARAGDLFRAIFRDFHRESRTRKELISYEFIYITPGRVAVNFLPHKAKYSWNTLYNEIHHTKRRDLFISSKSASDARHSKWLHKIYYTPYKHKYEWYKRQFSLVLARVIKFHMVMAKARIASYFAIIPMQIF